MRIALSVSAVVVAASLLSGCGPSSADAGSESESARAPAVESPAQVAASMLALARAGDWATYIDRYYGEQHKFQSPDDRDRLAEMLASRADQIVRGLEQVQGVTPEIAPDGSTATFTLPGGDAFTLYRSSGAWTFHL